MEKDKKEKGLSDKKERPFLLNELSEIKTEQKLDNNLLPEKMFNDSNKLFAFCEKIVKGTLCMHKKPEDAMIALITGRELGLGTMASLNGIYAVNGKASLGVHLKKGILLQNGIIFKKIRDCEPKYQFVETDKDGELKFNKDKKPIIVKIGFSDEQPQNTKKSKDPVDYQTVYMFTRYFKVAGKYVKNHAYGKFSYSDAKTAELLEKDNWLKYLRDMLSARAFSRGANEIADDLLEGMLSPSEMSDTDPNIIVTIDNNGIEQIIDNNQ